MIIRWQGELSLLPAAALFPAMSQSAILVSCTVVFLCKRVQGQSSVTNVDQPSITLEGVREPVAHQPLISCTYSMDGFN
jgi:hypothetical protein